MIVESQSADPHIHQLAIRLARKCRTVIQAVLRDEEVACCDMEFYTIIREGLEEFRSTATNERITR